MADFVTLSCPTCGGQLEITEDVERFACGYCGYEHLVQRRGGIVTLKAVTEELAQIRGGTARTASELAIRRLQKEIRELEQEITRRYARIESDYRTYLNGYFAEKYCRKVGLLKYLAGRPYVRPPLASLTSDQLRDISEHAVTPKPKRFLWAWWLFYGSTITEVNREGIAEALAELRKWRRELEKKKSELQKHRRIVSDI